MMRRTLLTASVVLIVGALAPELPAEARMDPTAFINNLGHQLQMVTSNTSPEQRLVGFRELFREDFDVPGLGRFVLGRYWWALTPSQQQEFLGLFENYVVLTYSDRLSEFADSGDVPKVTGCRADPDGALVSSEIVRGAGRGPTAQPIKVDWRLTEHDGIYKISDVVIAGLSMAVNGTLPTRRCRRAKWRARAGYTRGHAATDRKRCSPLDRRSRASRKITRPMPMKVLRSSMRRCGSSNQQKIAVSSRSARRQRRAPRVAE